jgi:hypothetical protein
MIPVLIHTFAAIAFAGSGFCLVTFADELFLSGSHWWWSGLIRALGYGSIAAAYMPLDAAVEVISG